MSQADDDLAVRRRKLTYRSHYTGTKETDILLSRFAEKYLPTFGTPQMDLYEEMLTVGDPEILAWVVNRKPVPPEHDNEVTRLLLQFDFSKFLK